MFLLRAAALVNWIFGLSKAFAFLTTTLNILKIAFMTNPIGFLATALAIAATLIIQNWQSVKDFFVNFFDSFKSLTDNPIYKFMDRLSSIGKDFFGFGGEVNISNDAMNKANNAAAAASNVSTHVENKQQFNINTVSHSANASDVAGETVRQLNNSLVGGD
jgi:hypothetical protein